jgi:hypothetical protein
MSETTSAPAAVADPAPQQFPVGQRTLTATVTNAEGASVPDTLSWSASSGTLTPSADTLTATLDNAAVGTVTVTVTDPAGLTASVTFDVVDATPAAISLTVA